MTLTVGMRVRKRGTSWGTGTVVWVADSEGVGLDGRQWATFQFGDWTFQAPAEHFESAEDLETTD